MVQKQFQRIMLSFTVISKITKFVMHHVIEGRKKEKWN